MLKFDDDRSKRARANSRALRRMVLRVTARLPPERCRLQPAFRTLFIRTENGIVMRDTVNRHDVTTLTSTSGSLCTVLPNKASTPAAAASASSLLRTVDVAAQVRQLLETNEFEVSQASLDLCTTEELTNLQFARRSQFVMETKDVPFGSSPYDLPITRYLFITRDWLVALCEYMLKRGYSLSYLKCTLKLVRSDSRGTFPLVPSEYAAFLRSIVAMKQKFFATRNLQSDGVYTMDEQVFQRMRRFCANYVQIASSSGRGLAFRADTFRATKRYHANELLFCFVFTMMFHTGKRCSDLAVLTVENLRQLLREDDLAIRIPKTERVGRISMKHVEEPEKLREFLGRLVALFDRDAKLQIIPFDPFKQRRALTKMFEACYEAITQKAKPKGLAFHALRRRKAGRYFKDGENLETIRECLDHAHTSMTNTYINKFLLATNTSKSVGGSGNNSCN